MSAKSILVLLHETDDRFDGGNYLLALLLRQWKQAGVAVEIIRGTRRFVPADVIIPHLDLTVMPEEYRDFLRDYGVAINRRVVDISKSRISSNILRRDDAYGGEVIVKTDRNYGGDPEKRLAARRAHDARAARSLTQRVIDKATAMLPRKRNGQSTWDTMDAMKSGTYPVYTSLRDVPAEVFENRNLVVEKFVAEMDGGDYCVRYGYFCGDQQVHVRLRSKQRVIKGSNAFACELAPAPPQLENIRRGIGLDYGKIDYVLRDGEPVIFDVNRTPSYSTLELHGLLGEILPRLADGIASATAVS